jgi:hypothetical protein
MNPEITEEDGQITLTYQSPIGEYRCGQILDIAADLGLEVIAITSCGCTIVIKGNMEDLKEDIRELIALGALSRSS